MLLEKVWDLLTTQHEGLFATRDIRKGQVIFREKPLVWQQWTPNKVNFRGYSSKFG